MSSGTPVALVTGANKGIGFGIVRELCRQTNGTIYLAARDQARGQDAVQLLKDEGLNANFLRLDVTDVKSIESARDFIKNKHGGLDILINNAGIFVGTVADKDRVPSAEAAKTTLATNFTGLLDVCNIMFPLLRPHARVVNVSSSLGSLRSLKIDALKQRLVADDLTILELEKMVQDYIRTAEDNKLENSGYPGAFGPYAFSKILVTALTRVQQRMFDRQNKNQDIVVNAVCPGFVATDMNQHQGFKTIEQGADSPVYLALLPPQQNDLVHPRGQLISERIVKNWIEDQ
ncbi:carbonyl reductase [NADPH] 3-like [Paramacrobiotus metropolitanus]|uniref:carbonyl reductase [NADPH] 3-like n=1 Tax=Paramacrobiotus metropolitanus TaxID=2943436 RepID=UPI002445C2B3|nr:carbonyl reductase [NADPH] 3-like [Paramacrobiotus metropolitanus]